jgi:Xaa-Pro aminopeptidase
MKFACHHVNTDVKFHRDIKVATSFSDIFPRSFAMPTILQTAPSRFAAPCAARRRALLAQASREGLQGVLVFGHGSSLGAGSRSHGALRYLAQWDGHEAMSLLVCTASACTLLVGSPFLVPLARQQHPEFTVVDAAPTTWGVHVPRLLGDMRGVATVSFGEMPQAAFAPLQAALAPYRQQTLDVWLDAARGRLDDMQETVHREAAARCDRMFEALGPALRRGLPAWRIQLDLSQLALELGADYCRTWLTAMPQADYPRYWKEECLRVPQAGDQVLFGVMLTVDGHWGHGIRMGHLGRPSPELAHLHARTVAALDAGLGVLRCGAPLDTVEAAMQAQLPVGDGGSTHFRYGHGLGHSYEEAHATVAFPQWFGGAAPAASPAPAVNAGMLLELHPNTFVPGLGGAAIGEMVLVHEDRAECLLAFPRELADWS